VIPEHTGLIDFLSAVIRQRGQLPGGEGPDMIRQALVAAEQSMIDNGIVAVGDICNTADTLEQKQKGRLQYYNFIEAVGFVEQGARLRFNGSKTIFDLFETAFPGMNSMVPHAPYSVSPALFRLIAGHGAGQLLTMHNQETAEENIFFLTGKGDFLRLYELLGVDASFFKGTGKRSLESVMSYFHPDQTMILVHDVATNAEDLQAVTDAGGPGIYFCLCPNANRYIGGRLPDVGLLMRSGHRLVVGTDSLASNHTLSILDELRTLQTAFPELGTATLLQWATGNGARALRLGEKLGSFVPGKKPGVVLLTGLAGDRLTPATGVRRLL
ncbi:MAG TPA: amidohydrolase family protein, partial [Puia sp.]|nr:amidohydrolase family protein [Puia sp.]